MENAPHIIISGRNIPPDIGEKYLKWYDEVYAPLYMRIPGLNGIDRYNIVKKTLEYPDTISIYHHENRDTLAEHNKNQVRVDLVKDMQTTFYRIELSWHEVYVLNRSFKKDPSTREDTIIENAPIIHIEGYRLPAAERRKYDQWFMKWASRIYIPLLMKIPGLKAYNCFKLSDFSVRWSGFNYVETEIPPYVSIIYFENMPSYQNFAESLEYAAFKRNMEIEFPGSLSAVWSVQYQLMKSWRK
jgi:hypothetical protein